MNELLNQTVAYIVKNNYQSAPIFKKFGIDFCCGGNVMLKVICEKNGVNEPELLAELMKLNKQDVLENSIDNPSYDNLGKLVEHIIKTHHAYVAKRIPEIEGFLQKLVTVHSKTYPFLKDVLRHFNEVSGELSNHMWKEENILFPYIQELANAWPKIGSVKKPPFGTIQKPIQMMEYEHESAGDAIRSIRMLTNDFTLPKEACNTFRVCYLLLEEFETDLHRHIHLENNILFPNAIELEKLLLNLS